jgi:hypothetical protein
MDGEATPYINIDTNTDASTDTNPSSNANQQATEQIAQRIVNQLDSPRIPGRKNPPSHIALCTEFLHRRQLTADDQPITSDYHVNEDDAVCRDWSTPHLSLMQIFSSDIIGYVAQKYKVHYQHNCQRDLSPNETSDKLTWDTAQELFPPSGLILDNGVVEEEMVADLCKGCIAGFNQEQQRHHDLNDADPDNPNPPWFHPHQTHHCILYPNTSRPLVNDQQEIDLVAVKEQRALAQGSAFKSVLETVTDRLQLMAVEYKLSHGDPTIASVDHAGSTTSDNAGDNTGTAAKLVNKARNLLFGNKQHERKKRILQAVPVAFGTNVEEQNGAVLYLDDGSVPLPMIRYAAYIPSTVSTIDILISPLCSTVYLSNGQLCIKHAMDIFEYMKIMYPNSLVEFHMISSTAAAFSRMILAKFLVCPPGTSACLMPALAKEEDTFAVVAETPQDLSTFQYFDFVDTHDDHLQVIHMAEVAAAVDDSSGGGIGDSGNVNSRAGTTPDTTATATATTTTATTTSATTTTSTTATPAGEDTGGNSMAGATGGGLSFENFLGAGEYRDGCVELRGKLGSWELDYSYDDLKTADSSSRIRGKSNVDVVSERFSATDTNPDSSVEARFGAWSEEVNPECALDMLNLNGLCEVVFTMGLGVIQFVGDQYTEQQVKSFWALLGLEDADDAGAVLVDGQDLPQYRKTAHCPREGIAFDIVFTPNEYLIQTVEVEGPIVVRNNPETRYVPVESVVNNYFYDNSSTANDNSNTSNADYQQYLSRTQYQNNWSNQPYGGYGGYGRGFGGGMGMAMVPVYNAGCCCVPFQNQYQQYAGGTGGAAGQPAVNTGGAGTQQRQVIVAGHTPNTDLDTYIEGIDDFNSGITDYASENDIVVLRSGFESNEQGATTGGRRMKENVKKMSAQELNSANKYLIKSVDEYRRRTRQMDLAANDPAKSGLPSIHVLDVSLMTNTHPHAKSIPNGRRNEQVASLYDHWNHLLYSNLRDIAAAEHKRKTQLQYLVETAPEGSPYHNGVETFAGYL